MADRTDVRKLLVLHGPTLESEGIVSELRGSFDVSVVQELEDALDALREGRFGAVLAEIGDFLPLERGVSMQQASVVLDRIGDGVCIVGSGGEMVWANRRMQALAANVQNMLKDICKQAYERFAADPKDDDHGRRFSLKPDDITYYEVICSPVRDRDGLLKQVVALVVDSTSQRRQQLKLNAIDSAGRELVRLEAGDDAERDATERLKILEERIIRYSHEVLNYKNLAVFVLDERTNRLEMLISDGLDERAGKYELLASPESNGISGYVAATGQSYICPDVLKDPRYLSALPNARSSLTVPLRLHGKVVGVLNAESDRPGAFLEEDRQFAEIFANYVALALHILNLLASERYTTHTQISDSICAELAGPLGDIITEACQLKEDYIGLDALRVRLDTLIDRATQARETMNQFARAPQTGVLGAIGEKIEEDPILTGKRILVADDEEIIRETVSSLLKRYGCILDIAADGTEAQAKASSKRYDLIISDIKMPGATGYDVFAAAKANCAETEVILITAFGYDPNHSVVRASGEGLAAVLLKPFKIQRLLDECRGALAPHRC